MSENGDDNKEQSSHSPRAGQAHDTTPSYQSEEGNSLVQEILHYLKGPEGKEAMEVIFSSQCRVAARLALSEDAKRAARMAAEEAAAGSFDGLERKGWQIIAGLPSWLFSLGFVLLGCYAVLLSVGLLCCLWRFALFGVR